MKVFLVLMADGKHYDLSWSGDLMESDISRRPEGDDQFAAQAIALIALAIDERRLGKMCFERRFNRCECSSLSHPG